MIKDISLCFGVFLRGEVIWIAARVLSEAFRVA